MWLIPLGYLAYKSGMFPRSLGGLLIEGGVAYLIDLAAWFLVPEAAVIIPDYVVLVLSAAEVLMILYLLIRGLRVAPQAEQVPDVRITAGSNLGPR